MSSTPLVAKGSFLFRPVSTKRKKSASSASTPDKYKLEFQAFPDEPAETAQLRYEAFQQCYDVVERSFKNLSQLQHRDLALSLIDFLEKDHDVAVAIKAKGQSDNGELSDGDDDGDDASQIYHWPEGSTDVLHLPTVALSAGSSTLDHSLLFEYLCKRLRKDVTPFVILLNAVDCTTMKRLLRILASAVLEADASCPDHTTLSGLLDWLHSSHFSKSTGSENGRRSSASLPKAQGKISNSRSVVVILQDFEGFQSSLLDDFITLCHSYLDRIPFKLIFGMSSSSNPENVSTLLPPGVNDLLAITSFHSAPAMTYLRNVVEKVLFAPHQPFRLGYQTFTLLVSHFLNVNHSVVALHQGIKLAMLEHFRSMPLSDICCVADRDRLLAQTCSGNAECDLLRSLPSVRRYIEDQEAQTQLDLLRKNDSFKVCAAKFAADITLYNRQLLASLNAVHSLFQGFPEPSIGKQVLDVYGGLLKKSVVEQDAFKNGLKCFKLLSREEVIGRLKKCAFQLSDVTSNLALCSRCLDSAERLHALSTHSASTSDDQQSSRGEACVDDSAEPAVNLARLSTAERRHRLHQRLRSYQVPSSDQQKEFGACLAGILDELQDHFAHALRSPADLPLSELFYCGAQSARLLNQTTLASPRLSVQQALLNPYPILQCSCCEDSPDAPTASMPPLSVAYWICTECPRNINLHDWLMSFMSVIKQNDTTRKEASGARKKRKRSPTEKPIDDSVWQSAFIQSVSELQLLGFIKPTKQKTDHVRRLVWGRC